MTHRFSETSGPVWTPTRRGLLATLGAGLLAPKLASAATFSLVDKSGTIVPNGNTVTGPIDSTGADLLVLVLVADNGRITYIQSDSKGNSWTGLPVKTQSGGQRVQILYVANPLVGSGHTLTIQDNGVTFGLAYFAAFKGASLISPLDVQNAAVDTGATIQPGAITPSLTNELVISGMGESSVNAAPTVDSGMIIPAGCSHATVGGNHWGGGFAYKMQTAAATINPTWTSGSPGNNTCVIASFKSASSASGGTKFRHSVGTGS
jgi:hypothetical protein